MKRLLAAVSLAFLIAVPVGAQANKTQYCASVTISVYGTPHPVGPVCAPCPSKMCTRLPTCLPPLCGVGGQEASISTSSDR